MRKRPITITITIILCALALSAGAPPVFASPGSVVIADCDANGRLTQHYSVEQLQNALATMPADVQEYTGCYDVIQRVLVAEASRPHPNTDGRVGQGSRGSFLPAPVIVVVVALVLAGLSAGVLALRRRSTPGPGRKA